jgi:hypothetical protein
MYVDCLDLQCAVQCRSEESTPCLAPGNPASRPAGGDGWGRTHGWWYGGTVLVCRWRWSSRRLLSFSFLSRLSVQYSTIRLLLWLWLIMLTCQDAFIGWLAIRERTVCPVLYSKSNMAAISHNQKRQSWRPESSVGCK